MFSVPILTCQLLVCPLVVDYEISDRSFVINDLAVVSMNKIVPVPTIAWMREINPNRKKIDDDSVVPFVLGS